MIRQFIVLLAVGLLTGSAAMGTVITYGDMDVLGTRSYSASPTAGATLEGLAAGVITDASLWQSHGFPFNPSVGDFPGTDQIYVGSAQTGYHDGYSQHAGRLHGPQTISLDYASAVPEGHRVASLTLGVAADDFQRPYFGQPYTAWINGAQDATLTGKLNAINETGPVVHFFTIGIDPQTLTGGHVLTLAIDQGGTGGDGWAIDFLTVGVTTEPIPEPATLLLLLPGLAMLRRKH